MRTQRTIRLRLVCDGSPTGSVESGCATTLSDSRPLDVDHRAALIDACNARSDERSALTSITRIPSPGSLNASASPSTST